MNALTSQASDLLDVARRAQAAGDHAGAARALDGACAVAPGHPVPLNALGLALIAAGRAADAVQPLTHAVAADPAAPALRINLADAFAASGRAEEALTALDGALERDPYLLPALLRRAQLLERIGRAEESLRSWRALLAALPAEGAPPAYAPAVEHGRALVRADGAARLAAIGDLDAGGARARAYLEQLCGVRKVYVQQPTGPHFPYLPAIEYFDEALFPWLGTLEAAFPAIREELLALWAKDAPGFDPYVAFDPTAPVNQWSDLNHSLKWSAFFLWRDGRRIDDACARCPRTVAVVEALPLLDVPGKSPTVMFSILAPHTRIPAHTGTTNTRATVHLPLVVPGPARFRVGAQTRDWVEGRAWAFDDTIEHEAWNDAPSPRAILIVDAWNPYLDEAEREVVRRAAPMMRT